MMGFLRSAFVIARRDFVATVWSPDLPLFLVGPLLIIGDRRFVFGNVTEQIGAAGHPRDRRRHRRCRPISRRSRRPATGSTRPSARASLPDSRPRTSRTTIPSAQVAALLAVEGQEDRRRADRRARPTRP